MESNCNFYRKYNSPKLTKSLGPRFFCSTLYNKGAPEGTPLKSDYLALPKQQISFRELLLYL